jgi:hypothetical protein
MQDKWVGGMDKRRCCKLGAKKDHLMSVPVSLKQCQETLNVWTSVRFGMMSVIDFTIFSDVGFSQRITRDNIFVRKTSVESIAVSCRR